MALARDVLSQKNPRAAKCKARLKTAAASFQLRLLVPLPARNCSWALQKPALIHCLAKAFPTPLKTQRRRRRKGEMEARVQLEAKCVAWKITHWEVGDPWRYKADKSFEVTRLWF